ncbi:MAG: ABC transporter permease [Nanoarchaeota archaeon]|nr:ABC transporter permease [Nanoarchaeota archaeon]
MAFRDKITEFFRLSFSIANAEFKLRNEGSYLGILWYLLNPIMLFTLLFLVFRDRLGNDIPYYGLYLLLGIIMFNLFQESTLDASRVMRNYSGVIKSINFTRESFVSALLIKRIYSHLIEIVVFTVVLYYLTGSILGLIFYPIVLVLFSIFIYGICLMLSLMVVYFIDLDNIWNFFIRLLWFATPIFYSIAGQNRLFYLNLFNPLYYFITLAREIVIYNRIPELWIISGAFFFSAISLLIGIILFNKLKNKMPELI